jgi:dCTP deaminase
MLSRKSIFEQMALGNIFIDPFDENSLGPNSYDLRLGNWFIELLGYRGNKPVYGDFIYIPDGDRVMIPSPGLILGMTKERAGSKNNIVPVLKTRSTIMRMGIDLCKSAGLGDVGYFDQHWTIEITSHIPNKANHGLAWQPASLVVGLRVAQIYFEECPGAEEFQYNGQYRVDDWPLCMLPREFRNNSERQFVMPEDVARKGVPINTSGLDKKLSKGEK